MILCQLLSSRFFMPYRPLAVPIIRITAMPKKS
jgi:hypothetical protein